MACKFHGLEEEFQGKLVRNVLFNDEEEVIEGVVLLKGVGHFLGEDGDERGRGICFHEMDFDLA